MAPSLGFLQDCSLGPLFFHLSLLPINSLPGCPGQRPLCSVGPALQACYWARSCTHPAGTAVLPSPNLTKGQHSCWTSISLDMSSKHRSQSFPPSQLSAVANGTRQLGPKPHAWVVLPCPPTDTGSSFSLPNTWTHAAPGGSLPSSAPVNSRSRATSDR